MKQRAAISALNRYVRCRRRLIPESGPWPWAIDRSESQTGAQEQQRRSRDSRSSEKSACQFDARRNVKDKQLWTSVFATSWTTRRAVRSPGALQRLHHLHPAKISRDAVAHSFTWGMGGITFYRWVLALTGVFLMFYYYHPTKGRAFRDILYLLRRGVPTGNLLRRNTRWAAPVDHHGVAACSGVLNHALLKLPREFAGVSACSCSW
ncbi:MAG: hypothetical protein H6816_08155 [Phycisphaerales bacterium]|nr:hypothetical protein [Phycisphaerales bacterium]